MNRNTKQKEIIEQLQKNIADAIAYPGDDWGAAHKEGNFHLMSIKSRLQNNHTPTPSVLSIFREAYSYELHYCGDLEETYGEPDADLAKAKQILSTLPNELPDNYEGCVTLKEQFPDISALPLSLWSYFDGDKEELGIEFDLGDDGTDEMEQSLENLHAILSYFIYSPEHELKEFFESELKQLKVLAKWAIRYELLEEYQTAPRIILSLNDVQCILPAIGDYAAHEDCLNWYLDFIVSDSGYFKQNQ